MGRANQAIVATAMALVLLVPDGSALAHSEIMSTDPQAGEIVGRSIALIAATFNEEVTLPRVVVRDASGRIVTGRLLRGGPTDKVVFRPTRPLRGGLYLVQWRVRSADGHWVSGSWRFRVALMPRP